MWHARQIDSGGRDHRIAIPSASYTTQTFIAVLGRQDIRIEWMTLEGRDISEAITDAIGTVEAIVFS